MHPVLRYAVDQAQVECQVGIFQEEGHYHGVPSAYTPNTPVPNQEDQVKHLYTTQPAPRISNSLRRILEVGRTPHRDRDPRIPRSDMKEISRSSRIFKQEERFHTESTCSEDTHDEQSRGHGRPRAAAAGRCAGPNSSSQGELMVGFCIEVWEVGGIPFGVWRWQVMGRYRRGTHVLEFWWLAVL